MPSELGGRCWRRIYVFGIRIGTISKSQRKLRGGNFLDQAELLRYTIGVLEDQGVGYMVVGSFASIAYGEPRLTNDIDIVVRLNAEEANRLCAAFPEPEYYVSIAAARDAVARRGQFNVIHPTSGNKIDFIIARDDDWGRAQLARCIRRPILADLETNIASPEDVILGKLWYYQEGGSEKHLRDIVGMFQVSGSDIDRQYISRWAKQLGLEQPWQAVLERLE